MHKTVSLKAKIAVLLTVTLWASAFVGIRAGLVGYSPGGLATLRFIIAAILMLFIYLKFAKRDPIPVLDKLQLLGIGAIGIGWYNIALNYGEVSVSSSVSSFIISQSPIITSVFAMLFLGERCSYKGYIGMVISLFGVSLIFMGETKGMQLDIDILYVLVATLIGALYSIIQKPFLKKYHAIDVTAYIIWGGALMLLIFAPNLLEDIATAPLGATYAVIYLGIFPGVLAYVGWGYVLSEMPASRAVSFLYFMPIIATFIGWAWLSEVPSLLSFMGGLVALVGVWVVNHSYKSKELAAPLENVA